MNFLQALLNFLENPLPSADVTELQAAIGRLQELANNAQPIGRHEMTSPTPTDLVSISQADLTNFADEISAAVAVLAPYIQQLIAGQQVTLAAADESAVTAAVQSLQNLEPPAPTPPSS